MLLRARVNIGNSDRAERRKRCLTTRVRSSRAGRFGRSEAEPEVVHEINHNMAGEKLLARIEVDPRILVGKPVIRGTRIPVELILKKLGQNIDVQEILQDFPRLTKEDVKAAIMYAESLVEDTEMYPLAASS